ncbi:extensin family protein [Pantoea sp. CS_6]|uniref:extensin-like domain-containing protein n=1 Tax=Pantoea TaxID=53335 RepID=UPI0006D0C126|nr:extensin family protein [Pantoea stewartii]
MRTLVLLIIMTGVGWMSLPWLKQHLPAQFNPFTPLSVTDPPGWMTRLKLKRLQTDPAACLDVMQRAQQAGVVHFSQRPAVTGACPLSSPLRLQNFGPVSLSSSFLASCPMAVAATMYVAYSREQMLHLSGSDLTRIEHVGSYACRNIYHQATGRLSEHASADAWDITAYQLANGERLVPGKNWQQPGQKSLLLHALWRSGCNFFGNALGPDYNRAHATHFHLGMRGAGYCR